MPDELGPSEKDHLWRCVIKSNMRKDMSSPPRWNHKLSSGAAFFRISGIASVMTSAAAYTSISPRAISKMAFQMTDSSATTDFGRAVPRDLEYWETKYESFRNDG
jgi:hypothetical protein